MGGCGIPLCGATPMHHCCQPMAAWSYPGQQTDHKHHLLACKAQEITELALSRQKRYLHSALTSAKTKYYVYSFDELATET